MLIASSCSYAPECSQSQHLSVASTTVHVPVASPYSYAPGHHQLQLSSPAFTAIHMPIASPWCHMSAGWNPGPCSRSGALSCPDFCQWPDSCLCWQPAPIAAYLLTAGSNSHHWHPPLRTHWWLAPAVTVHVCCRFNAILLKLQCYFCRNREKHF